MKFMYNVTTMHLVKNCRVSRHFYIWILGPVFYLFDLFASYLLISSMKLPFSLSIYERRTVTRLHMKDNLRLKFLSFFVYLFRQWSTPWSVSRKLSHSDKLKPGRPDTVCTSKNVNKIQKRLKRNSKRWRRKTAVNLDLQRESVRK